MNPATNALSTNCLALVQFALPHFGQKWPGSIFDPQNLQLGDKGALGTVAVAMTFWFAIRVSILAIV